MQMSRVSGAARAASCLQPLSSLYLFSCSVLIYTPLKLLQDSATATATVHRGTIFYVTYRSHLKKSPKQVIEYSRQEVPVEPAAVSSGRPPRHVASRLLVTPNKKTPSATQPRAVASSSQLLCLRSCPAATPWPVLTA